MIVYVVPQHLLYDIKIKLQCDKWGFDDGNAVSESNLAAFLTEVSITDDINAKKTLLYGSAKCLVIEFLAGYARAVGTLQTAQPALRLVNKNVSACDIHTKNLLTDYDREKAIKRHAVHEDHGTNPLNDGYRLCR